MYILSEEEKERIHIIKLLSILFVVYIHAYTTRVNFSEYSVVFNRPKWLFYLQELFSRVIPKCGVPLFFLLSSILFFKKERQYKQTIIHKLKTLCIPYFFWNTFWIVILILLQSLPFISFFISGQNKDILQCTGREWLSLYGIGIPLPPPKCHPLWFLRDLMLVLLFYPLLKKITNFLPVLCLLIGITLTIIPLNFPLKTALAWLIIGASIVKLQIHITLTDGIPVYILTPIYLLFATFTLFIDEAIVKKVFILFSIVFWVRISKVIYQNTKLKNVLLWFSQWTFMIYVMHELSLFFLNKLCLNIFNISPLSLLLEYLFCPIIVIFGCILVGMVLKRYFPKIYAFSMGGR